MIEVANGQHTGPANRPQYLSQPFSFRHANKQNMAALQIGKSLESDDPKRMSIDLLVQNGLAEDVIERVVADNADDERRVRRGKSFDRPFYKFSEVINKGGFELKFRGGGLLRTGRRAIEGEVRGQQQ